MNRMLKRSAAALAAFTIAFGSTSAHARSLVRDAEVERTIGRLAEPIFHAAGISPSSIDILILSDSSLNAFVFGGRNMVLNTGLLTRLDTPESLMSVIAHETGHIIGGHLTRRAVNAENLKGPVAAGVLLAILAGVASGSSQVAVAGALGAENIGRRSFLAYSRAEEASADQAGATFLEAAGIDPAYALDVLKIFRGQEVFQSGVVDPYARTHPLSQERLSLLEDRAASTHVRDGRVSEELQYWHARMRVKLAAFLDRPQRTLRILDATDAPDSELNLMRRAIALHRLPDPEGAVKVMDQLLTLRPSDPFYHELKGQILFESGQAARAVPAYRRAVRLAPNEALIRGGLGRALLATNDTSNDTEALKELETARAAGASEPGVLRDLALAYARAGKEGAAALATAERYAITGEPALARRHARRALDQLPVGSPGWLRADDIQTVAERTLSDR